MAAAWAPQDEDVGSTILNHNRYGLSTFRAPKTRVLRTVGHDDRVCRNDHALDRIPQAYRVRPRGAPPTHERPDN